MSDTSLLDLVLPAPALPRRRARASAIVSAAVHVSLATVMVLLASGPPKSDGLRDAARPTTEPIQLPRMVFLQLPGPGGGGGGGGNRQPAPPSRAQGIGRDRITMPIAAVRVVKPQPAPAEAEAPQLIVLNAVPLAAGDAYHMGMPEAPSSLPNSLGPGVGGGVGTGRGTGIGSGTGPGFGPGSGGGFGGGIYRPGNGVTAPTLISQVRPNYTSDAMQRKIQGTVMLEMIVGADGSPYDVRVVRSLDPHGLDDEAMRAAKQWRFNPGRFGEMPVDVLVVLVIDFHIR
jgi:protein TonB